MLGSEMILSELVFTTFEANLIFFGSAGGVVKIGLSLKWNNHKQI
jgi:hypothetical protein